ncbi:helix-turn-helix domain-containing protein [Pontibacter sp. 172403-2]|uniref:AraC family transcriptional regulator n=1 Tax=Pontibacter rufus TaxID=2791028 RepID=UPI0018AF6371|nr:AraC family transcriptional regulator [Pontibacter sp. 172403-2]MBF9255157.1 helix-turn-helix domain-containing protein [Pontibacter sp. 172403-2]
MKLTGTERLPIQDLLQQKALTIVPLETYASALSEVPHSHDAYMIMYVQETKGGDNLIDFQRYPLQAGRVFLLRPGQAHQRRSRQEKGVLVSFSESFLQTTGMSAHDAFVIFSSVYQHPYLDLPDKLKIIFEELVNLMAKELQEPQPGMDILSRYLYILLQYLLRECQAQIEKLTPARYSERLFRLSSLVEAHYHEHKSVSFYASALDITPKHLNSLCRQYLHTSVADMQHERLIVESKRLLLFSSLSVKEIAYQLGFEDASYFVRFFKRITGQTPTQLRSGGSESTVHAAENPVS